MTPDEILQHAQRAGMSLWVDEGHLRFRAPPGAMSAELRAALSTHKQAVIDLLRAGGEGESAADGAGEAADAPFPLTDMQQAYWLGRQEHYELGGVSAYAYFEFESETIDLERLQAAWRRMVSRHEMLRATVSSAGDQRIAASVPDYLIEVVDSRDVAPEVAARRLTEERARMSHQVLPLDRWPLFEIRAHRLSGPERVRLFIGLDMLIMDAQSFLRLFDEWRALYRDPDLVLPTIGYSFRTHARSRRSVEDTPAYRRALAYWRDKLADLPMGPEFATEPSAPAAAPRFTRRSARLDADTWACLRRAASERGLSPSMALCAVYSLVLAAWSRHPRFTLNLTLLGRPDVHPDIHHVIGDFTSGVLLEVDDSSVSSPANHARALQQQFWRNMEHASVGTVQVLRELARTRARVEASMPVVFTSLLDQTSTRDDEPSPTAWLGQQVFGVSQTPQVCLDHQVYEQHGELVFHWDGVEERFGGRLDDMFAAYVDALTRLAGNEQIWDEAPLRLVPREQLAQRARVNATEAPVSSALLHALFDERAQATPDALAIIDGARRLTYAELSRMSRALSQRLRERPSVQPGTLVAVIMRKSWQQVVAVLGVLGAGAAYLPLDPGLPPERLRHLLADARVRVVLVSEDREDAEEALDVPPELERVAVGEAALADGPAPPWELRQRPDELAYVIYTSGSTGMPKGVMIDHRGAVNTILDINQRFAVVPGDRVLAVSALTFDLSVYDVFGTLAAGATIVMPSGAANDAEAWARLVREHEVTVWNSVPVLLEMLVEVLERAGVQGAPSLRLVLLSGDWIPLSLPERAKAQSPRAQLVSLGGATEASIWSIFHPITRVEPGWNSIPYGTPLQNQQLYVLDDKLEPCPDGVPGHLYIGGVGLALGYWGDPERTAASFCEHPRSGQRLYRTGDWGRYDADGVIEFLGRTDTQVKILGHRIECGEIEAALRDHDAVQDAIVTVSEIGGAKKLVGYALVAEDDLGALAPAALRAFLRQKIPAYMVPSHILALSRWPLTGNGKVDRRALPAPDVGGGPARQDAAPRTVIEQTVATLFGQAIEVPVVDDVAANFFELGGDSLRALRLTSALSEAFELQVSTRALLENPTVEGVAELIEELLIDQMVADEISVDGAAAGDQGDA
ncbi:MAG: hypothetical protein Tsb0020_23980 [Haliangiales bacterium]